MYNVKQGWEPLCMFLGCEVPQESFPWVNRGQRAQRGTLRALAQRKQELTVKLAKDFVIFMALFVLFFSFCYMKF